MCWGVVTKLLLMKVVLHQCSIELFSLIFHSLSSRLCWWWSQCSGLCLLFILFCFWSIVWYSYLFFIVYFSSLLVFSFFLFWCLLLGLLFYFVFCHLCTHVVCLHAEIYHTPLNFAFLMFGICSNFLTREIDVIVFFKISLWSIFLFWIWTAKLHLCSCKFLVLTNNDTNKCKFFNISWFEKGICLCLTQMLSLMTCGS